MTYHPLKITRTHDLVNGQLMSWMPPEPPRQTLETILPKIPRLAQRQDSTNAQLRDLQRVANRLGMYGAADIIRGLLERAA